MNTTSPFTEAQTLAFQTAPRITGTMSIIGSCLIVYEILKRGRKNAQLHHRILLYMSVTDIFNSIAFFLANWPMLPPAGVGTQVSCDIQGWMLQFGLSIPFWNALLALTFLLRIRYEVTEIELKEKEKYFHLAAWTWPLITAFICLGLGLYNSATLWCWIAPYPSGCNPKGNTGEPCTRGKRFVAFQFGFFFVPLWVCVALVVVAMFLIYKHVSNHEKNLSMSGIQTANKQKIQVGVQASFYSAAFILTWIFGSINRLVQAGGLDVFGLVFLHSLFVPAQGFFNYLVYKFPEIRAHMEKHGWKCCGCFEDYSQKQKDIEKRGNSRKNETFDKGDEEAGVDNSNFEKEDNSENLNERKQIRLQSNGSTFEEEQKSSKVETT